MKDATADVIIAAITGDGWMGKDTGGRQRPTREEVSKLAYNRYVAMDTDASGEAQVLLRFKL